MRKTILIVIFSFTINSLAYTQYVPPIIQWQNTIGGIDADFLGKLVVKQTPDGGYIIGGSSYSGISGDKTELNNGPAFSTDYWVIKLNSIGGIVWQNSIGGDGNDIINCIDITTDGGYIIAGQSTSGISGDKSEESIGVGDYDYWIVKLTSTGDISWQNTIGGYNDDYPKIIKQTSDGGYIVAGHSYSYLSGDKTEGTWGADDYWVLKLDASGSIVWQNTIGGEGSEVINALGLVADGYILGGYSGSGISGDKTEPKIGAGSYDYWVLKIDLLGNIVWQNTIGGNGNDELNALVVNNDEKIILGGFSNSNISGDKTENNIGEYDYWVLKLNSAGTIIWQNTIGGIGDDRLFSLNKTADGGYVLGGESNSEIMVDKSEPSFGGYDYWFVKINNSGSVLWDRSFGGSLADNLTGTIQCADGGYMLSGSSYSGISGSKTEAVIGNSDLWLIKTFEEINCAELAISTFNLGDSIFSCSSPALIDADTGFDSYLWNTGNTEASISAGASGWYSCIVTQSGCIAEDSVHVQITPLSLTASFTPILCNGNVTTVIATAAGGTGTLSYKIDASPWQLSNIFTGVSAGAHLVKVKDSKGCIESSNINITSPSVLDVTASATSITCYGGVSTITSTSTGGTPSYQYSLNGGPLQISNVFTGVTAGTYSVSTFDANNCTDIYNLTITEPAALSVNITAGGPTTFCQGGSVMLTASYTGISIQWKKDGINITGATNSTYTATQKATYTCQTTSECGTALSTGIYVNVQKNPTAIITAGGSTTFCTGGSVTLTANAGVGLSYQWYKGAAAIPGATSINYVATTTGNYKCRVTKAATGCYKISNGIVVTVTCKEGENNFDINVFPNPTNNVFNISSNKIIGLGIITVTDVNGKLIITDLIKQTDLIEVNLENFANGMYFIKIEENGNHHFYKIIKN